MILLDYIDTKLKEMGSPLISDTFRGSMKSHLQCILCLKENCITEPFNQLILPIRESVRNHRLDAKMSNLEQDLILINDIGFFSSLNIFNKNEANLNIYYCLKSFSETQKTDYFCPKCEKVTDHTIRFSIDTVPKYFITSLKRFRYARWNSKVSDQVFLPNMLDLVESCGIKDRYELIAVIQHVSYFFKGHYKVYVKKGDQWYLLDDKKVSKVTWGVVFNSQAYVFMYKRIENNQNPEEKKHEAEGSNDQNIEEMKHEAEEGGDNVEESMKYEERKSSPKRSKKIKNEEKKNEEESTGIN